MNFPEYRALGFDITDATDFDYLLEDLSADSACHTARDTGHDAAGYTAALGYLDPSGARLTALQEEGEGWKIIPGFRTRHTIYANCFRATQYLAVAELVAQERVYARVACAADAPFALPASFPGGKGQVRIDELQLAAAALDFELFDSPAAAGAGPLPILHSPSCEAYYRSYSPRNLSPVAELAGVLVGVEERVNELGDSRFFECGIELPGGILTVLLPEGADPREGNIFHGLVLMLASTGHWDNVVAQ